MLAHIIKYYHFLAFFGYAFLSILLTTKVLKSSGVVVSPFFTLNFGLFPLLV